MSSPPDEEDDFGDLEPLPPRQMTGTEMADAVEAMAKGNREFDPALLLEVAPRLRSGSEIRAALLFREEENKKLKAEVARLRRLLRR